MKNAFHSCCFALIGLFTFGWTIRTQPNTWGFFGHKRINRLAVLTLPPDMMVFFKPHIDFITDHAVDPDMRRYATRFEAPRHFIDLDQYGPPFDSLPHHWVDALAQYADIQVIDSSGDTLLLISHDRQVPPDMRRVYRGYFNKHVLPRLNKNDPSLDPDSLAAFLTVIGSTQRFVSARCKEHLSEHGILPWNLQRMQRELTEAFRQRNARRILRLATDMGHYIGDAHVPLHTSSNYNGQKTGQQGIHGFWESRIPELFADESYDFFTGKPEYISNTTEFFWSIVLTSNSMVDSVLSLEKKLRQRFPPDRQVCPEFRSSAMVLAPCRDFAAAYQDDLQHMVERRMRSAIHAVGSAWFTAWVDAGQPDLSRMETPAESESEQKDAEMVKRAFEQGRIQGRPETH